MAVFLDLENIALGARDARFPRFDIQKVLERLLLKGHIVVKKAYCDFDRYKEFKRDLHEAAFELIEIPHLRMSGKNSADIRMVVDALDLCYTKGHVDTFVILSGDSDFSPLVSKLRENDKTVIGVGVKNSTSDLFINNCDTFIYYDDLVRVTPSRSRVRPKAPAPVAATGLSSASSAKAAPVSAVEAKASLLEKTFDQVVETVEDLAEERDEDDVIWIPPAGILIEDQTYYWRVRAYLGPAFSPWTEAWAFTINMENFPPGTPLLRAPADDSVVAVKRPIFECETVTDPDGDQLRYLFHIYNSRGGAEINGDGDIQPDGFVRFVPNQELIENAAYTWEVVAIDESGDSSEPSERWAFTVNVENGAPEAPSIVYPEERLIVDSVTPTFRATGGRDLDSAELFYVFQVRYADPLDFQMPTGEALVTG